MRAFEILLVLGILATQGDDLTTDAEALLSPRHAAVVGGGAALAAVGHSIHDDLHAELHGDWYIDRPSDLTDVYGSGSVNLPAALGLSLTGRLAGRPRLQELGDGLTRTLTLAHVVVGPIKLAAHRRRPDGSDRFSFPSGHSANTFAVARYLQCAYGTRVALLPYALAITTAVGRMEGDRHYLSDVIVGASLGIVVGSAVGGDGPAQVEWATMGGGTGLVLRIPLSAPGN